MIPVRINRAHLKQREKREPSCDGFFFCLPQSFHTGNLHKLQPVNTNALQNHYFPGVY